MTVSDAAMQLLESLQNGQLNEDTIGSFRYLHLISVALAAKQMEEGADLYQSVKGILEEINIARLRRKDRLTVAIMADISGDWIGDELFQLLDRSERFDPYVVLPPQTKTQSGEVLRRTYEEDLAYFQKRPIRLLSSMDPATGRPSTWADWGIRPDLFIWLNPWPKYRDDLSIENMPLNTLHTYIPYGFMLASDKEHTFSEAHFNQGFHLVMWRIFYDAKATIRMAAKHGFLGDSQAVYTGYPKMDRFYDEYKLHDSIWQRVLEKSGNQKAKKIIYAPHHTIETTGDLQFSTFRMNYRFMLYLARRYAKDTVWVFRPHPLLRQKTIQEGMFRGLKEWDDYVAEWDSLDNAISYETGDYADLMLNSDGMIMDCVSFIGEYMYSCKPLLFLESGSNVFNEFGEDLIQNHYRAKGDDYAAIEDYLVSTILHGDDEKRSSRRKYFEENLDYRKDFGGKDAARNIYEYLENSLFRPGMGV